MPAKTECYGAQKFPDKYASKSVKGNVLKTLFGFRVEEKDLGDIDFDSATLSALKNAGITNFFSVYARYREEDPLTEEMLEFHEAVGDFRTKWEANTYAEELSKKYETVIGKKLKNQYY